MYETVEKYSDATYPVQNFESIQDIIQHIENTKDVEKYVMYREVKENPKFYGTDDFRKTIQNLRYGKDEITVHYLDTIKQLKNDNGNENTGFFMDIQGCAYDMGAVVAGEPECCINQGFPETKPHLAINIDTGYCGSTKQDSIDNRGVAIYQLITNLLARGYILDINFVHYIECHSCGYKKVCQKFKISTENIDVSKLAIMGSCEFFRAITWLLTAIQIKQPAYSGDGTSMPCSEAIEQMKKDGLFIPSGYTDERFNYCSLEEAIKYVTDIYNEYAEGKC